MSFKHNTLANYLSQFYATFIAIVMLPLYLKYLGAEAYGLVGFYAMLQAWFQLLDMGLTPTMTRQTARYNGGEIKATDLRHLLRALECIFILIACSGTFGMIAGSDFIANKWLNVQTLNLAEVRLCIMLMAVIVALRWVCGLYRGSVTGFERLIWLSCFNSTMATLRFVMVVPFFIYIGTRPSQYFYYQLAIAVVEVCVLVFKTYRLMPGSGPEQDEPFKWRPLAGVLKFSLSIAVTSAVWVVITQTDKLVLSKLLTLSDYAYFSLAVMVANGVMIVSGPISSALLPRMTVLNAKKDETSLIQLYRNATQFVGIIAIPAALVLTFFAEQLLWAWTGDSEIARKAGPVLTLYAMGNGLLALAAFPFYFQFAKGDMKLHVIGNLFFVVLFIPLLLWSTNRYGMIGAGYAWLSANLLPFIVWLPFVHARFVRGLHRRWLLGDVLPLCCGPLCAAVLLNIFIKWPVSQMAVGFNLLLVGMVLCLVAAASSSWIRKMVGKKWRTITV